MAGFYSKIWGVIPAIVLAAGQSSRMGRPKALLPIGAAGETFFDRVTRTLLDGGVHDVVVVVGADDKAIREAVGGDSARVRLVSNADWERGQLSSLLAGLRAVDRPGVTAALVTLIDSPLIAVRTVAALLEHHRLHRPPISRPVWEGRHGHPVIFDRPLFDELRHADVSRGAKDVVHAHLHDLFEMTVDDPGAYLDIDTREDYLRWVGPLE
jgi:molybdenum cofactor cytidylyltransferase